MTFVEGGRREGRRGGGGEGGRKGGKGKGGKVRNHFTPSSKRLSSSVYGPLEAGEGFSVGKFMSQNGIILMLRHIKMCEQISIHTIVSECSKFVFKTLEEQCIRT